MYTHILHAYMYIYYMLIYKFLYVYIYFSKLQKVCNMCIKYDFFVINIIITGLISPFARKFFFKTLLEI